MVGAMSRIDRMCHHICWWKSGAGAIAKPRGTETRRYGRPGEVFPTLKKLSALSTALAYR